VLFGDRHEERREVGVDDDGVGPVVGDLDRPEDQARERVPLLGVRLGPGRRQVAQERGRLGEQVGLGAGAP